LYRVEAHPVSCTANSEIVVLSHTLVWASASSMCTWVLASSSSAMRKLY
jgi:hypothetical protein